MTARELASQLLSAADEAGFDPQVCIYIVHEDDWLYPKVVTGGGSDDLEIRAEQDPDEDE